MPIHPTTDAVLIAQREKLAELTPADTPLSVQRQVSRELLWHAMHTLAMLDPNVDMADIAHMCRDAITRGVAEGRRRGY